MEAVREFYTEALRKNMAENETDEEKEYWRGVLREIETQDALHPKTLNPDKAQWFESLTDRVIAFAKNGNLNLKQYITNDYYGAIIFETSYFELSWIDDPEYRVFWQYLFRMGLLSITQGEDTFKIQFLFALYAV